MQDWGDRLWSLRTSRASSAAGTRRRANINTPAGTKQDSELLLYLWNTKYKIKKWCWLQGWSRLWHYKDRNQKVPVQCESFEIASFDLSISRVRNAKYHTKYHTYFTYHTFCNNSNTKLSKGIDHDETYSVMISSCPEGIFLSLLSF